MNALATKGARLLAVLPLLVLFAGTSTFAQVPVSLPDIQATPGETVTAPVEVGDVSGEDIQAFDFTVTYDPSLVEVTANPSGLSASDNADFRVNNPSEGELSVAVTSGADASLDGSGSLAELEVTAASDVAGTTDLTFASFQFNEGTPSAALSAGSVSVQDVFVSLPDIAAQSGEEVEIDIETTDLTETGPRSYQFDLSYGPSVLSNVEVVQEGTLSEGIDLESTVDQDGGTVSVAASAGTESLEGSGTLLTIRGTLSSGSAPLEFSSFQFEEGRISAETQPGSLSVGDIVVSFPEVSAGIGSSPLIDVQATDLTVGTDVESYQFTFGFDPEVLDVTGIETEGTLSEGVNDTEIQVNGNTATVAVASSSPLEGSGSLIQIQTETVAVGESPLEFRSFQFNEGDPTAATEDGRVTVGDNQPPEFTDVPEDDTVAVGEELTATVDANDPNGDEVSFSLTEAPQGAEIDSESGDFSWTPTESQADSTYGIGVQASDGTASSDTSFAVTVEERPQARAQIIHNAADPAADTVDVYFDEERVLNDFAFRSATSFIDVPAETEIDVGIAPGDSESAADTLASFPVTFAEGQAHTVVANGVLNPDDFADNPDGQDISLTLFADAQARESAASADSVDLRAVHGATDAPTVDIDENGTTLFENLTYGDVTPDYLSAAAEMKRLVVTPGDSEESVAAFQADLSGLDGSAATVLASGFLDPSANQDGPAFRLVAVLADGTVVVFEPVAPIGFDVTRDFGDASVQANYELVALPGDVDIDLVEGAESGFSGEQGPDWRAFRELGATNGGDAELEAYDGSDAFNFREGRAFWVISKDQLSYQGTASPTFASGIALQGGWNAISNPLRSDLDWQAVQDANGLDEALFRWSGGWEQVDTLRSAQTGEGYYVFNSADLDSLSLSEEESENALASGEGSSRTVNLAVRDEGDKGSSITAGIGSETSTHRAPPTHFSSPKTTLRVLGSDSGNRYVRMVRSVDGESTTFSLMLRGEESERATLEASGLGAEGPEGAVLVEEETGQSYDLQETSTVTIEMGDDGEARLSLHVGSSEVNDVVAPDETELRGNYPNPFSQQTTVELALSEQADVKVRVYNVLGQKVATVADGEMDAGMHKLGWDGSSLSSGVYFVRMEAGSKTDVHKVTVVR